VGHAKKTKKKSMPKSMNNPMLKSMREKKGKKCMPKGTKKKKEKDSPYF
jgi:hypothetical protein